MNSRLLNIPAILVAVLTVSVGMFVYNSSQATITDTMTSMSTQEKDAFNNQFTSYEGYQNGSNVYALMGMLISNLHTYREEPEKVPQVFVDKLSKLEPYEQEAIFYKDDDFQNYMDDLNRIRGTIETKHEYYIEFTYQENGLIDYIQISYDTSNLISESKHREKSDIDNDYIDDFNTNNNYFNDEITQDEELEKSTQEIDACNNQFQSYEGEQTGSNVKALMGRLIGNADTYRYQTIKIPHVFIDKINSTNETNSSEAIITSDSEDAISDYINNLGNIRYKVETKHSYYIELTYQENGLIDYIQISYDPYNPITEQKHRD